MMISYVYINKDGLQEGPVSLESLRYLISVGKLDGRTLISDGMDAWAPAGTYPPTMALFQKSATAVSVKPDVVSKSSKSGALSFLKGDAHWSDVSFVALCLKIVSILPLLFTLIMIIVYSGRNKGGETIAHAIRSSADAGVFKLYLIIGLPSAVICGLFIYGFASLLLMVRSLAVKSQ